MALDHAHAASPESLASPVILRPSFGQLWQVPLLLLGLTTLAGVWATRPLWYDPDALQFRKDIHAARRMLDDPHGLTSAAVDQAADALTRVDRFPGRAGEAHFLLGSAYLRLTRELPADGASEARRKARAHLEQADSLGVPEVDRIPLMYRLAKVWFQTDGDLARAANYLQQSIEDGADDRREGYGMLAQAYLRLNNVAEALKANERELQCPTEDENLLAPARLLRGELLLRTPEPEARENARKVLGHIGSTAAAPIVARARFLMANSLQQDGAWAQAVPLWEAIVADRRLAPAEPGRVWYWLGFCYHQLGRRTDAIRAWERAQSCGGEESQAAMLRLAEARLDDKNRKTSLNLFKQALANVVKATDYHNELLGLPEAIGLLQFSCQTAAKNGDFETARELATIYARLVPAGPAQAMLAEIAEAWGKADRDRAKKEINKASAPQAEKTAQQHFREAGAAMLAVAESVSDKNLKIEHLWRAADLFTQGQDYDHVVGTLDQIIKLQPALERLSEAWFRLGEAHQALRHDLLAIGSFKNCIVYPGPFAYRARYELALWQVDNKHHAEAIEQLQQNLELMRSDPDREAQEKSLYLLADTYYRTGDYRSATDWWETALTLFPANLNVLAARLRLGDCYSRLAYVEQQIQLSDPPFYNGARPQYHKQHLRYLEQAAANFQKVADDLEAQRAVNALNEGESEFLMLALFRLADTRSELGETRQAIYMYDSLASRYQQQYEGLTAIRQLFLCQAALTDQGKTYVKEAHDTLKRGKQILNQLPDAIFKGRPESETRPAWENWLKQPLKSWQNVAPTEEDPAPPRPPVVR